MNKAYAIRRKCLDCGGSPKEVSICNIVACPIWLFRFGFSSNDQRFMLRMATAQRNYPLEFREMQNALTEHLKILANSSKKAQIANLLKKIKEL